MPRFFLETIAEDDIQITGADAHHIGYALRMRPGEHLTVCANNIDYDCADMPRPEVAIAALNTSAAIRFLFMFLHPF